MGGYRCDNEYLKSFQHSLNKSKNWTKKFLLNFNSVKDGAEKKDRNKAAMKGHKKTSQHLQNIQQMSGSLNTFFISALFLKTKAFIVLQMNTFGLRKVRA